MPRLSSGEEGRAVPAKVEAQIVCRHIFRPVGFDIEVELNSAIGDLEKRGYVVEDVRLLGVKDDAIV